MELKLKNKNWKVFSIEEIFHITSTASGIDKNKLNVKSGAVPYITRSEKENGYDSFVCQQNSKYNMDSGNAITIGLDTQTIFYQPYDFYTGQNIQVLANSNLTKEIALFIIPLLKRQMEKFNWGSNGATLTRLKRSKILLPSTTTDEPDYAFMEAYIQQLRQKKLTIHYNHLKQRLKQLQNHQKIEALEEKTWCAFFIEDIAEILAGKDIYVTERTKGCTPYISATANNNGIGYFVGNNNPTKARGCLSVNRNGSVGYSFYHPYNALFSNDCRKLRLKKPSKFIGIFISQQITKQKGKYGYGYKMGTARLKRQKIMLPIKENQEPDYAYMENYIKQLEYMKITQYLHYIDLQRKQQNNLIRNYRPTKAYSTNTA